MNRPVTLIPLTADPHAEVLQEVYRATPGYWAMYDLPHSPPDQAQLDLEEAASTPGRVIFGIVRRLVRADPTAGVEMVGMVDLRLGWPHDDVVYLAMVMVAEAHQRQGIGRRAWELLRPWLINSAAVRRVRVGVEQFNHTALAFFGHLGFEMTGESNRVRAGDKLVRVLYLERELEDR